MQRNSHVLLRTFCKYTVSIFLGPHVQRLCFIESSWHPWLITPAQTTKTHYFAETVSNLLWKCPAGEEVLQIVRFTSRTGSSSSSSTFRGCGSELGPAVPGTVHNRDAINDPKRIFKELNTAISQEVFAIYSMTFTTCACFAWNIESLIAKGYPHLLSPSGTSVWSQGHAMR